MTSSEALVYKLYRPRILELNGILVLHQPSTTPAGLGGTGAADPTRAATV